MNCKTNAPSSEDKGRFVSQWQGVFQPVVPSLPNKVLERDEVEEVLRKIVELNDPRYMTPGGIFDAYDAEITTFGRADLKDVEDCNLGLKGSPTKIAKASDKVRKGAGEKVTLDPTEAVEYLIGKFKEKHVI